MDDTLRIIQHLYDEDVDDSSVLRRMTEDAELRQEYEDLRAVKEVLDRRSSPSPSSDVVDRIVDHASNAAHPGSAELQDRRASDREAHTRNQRRMGRLRIISAVLTLLLFLGLGWWQFRTDDPTAMNNASPQQSESVSSAVEESPNAESMPEWNDRDEVMRLHRSVEQLRTRSQSDAWDNAVQSVDQGRP